MRFFLLVALTCLMPRNVWGSPGEAYYQSGTRKEAVRNYEKSLHRNLGKIGGKRMLERIRNEKERP